jgi:hypothetical protein
MARILSAYDKSIFELSKNFTKVTFKFPEKVAIKSGDKKHLKNMKHRNRL